MLPEARGEEEGEVDAAAEPDHDRERRRRRGEGDQRRQQTEDAQTRRDADDRRDDRQPRGEHTAEREQEHQDRDDEADQLRTEISGAGFGRLAEPTAVVDLDAGRAHRIGGLVDAVGEGAAEDGGLVVERDGAEGDAPAGRGRACGRRVGERHDVGHGPHLRDRLLDGRRLTAQCARVDAEHEARAVRAADDVVLGENGAALPGFGAGQAEIVTVRTTDTILATVAPAGTRSQSTITGHGCPAHPAPSRSSGLGELFPCGKRFPPFRRPLPGTAPGRASCGVRRPDRAEGPPEGSTPTAPGQ